MLLLKRQKSNMNPNDRIRIKHMLIAAEEALTFVEKVNYEEFSKNRMLILSVIKDIEIIGEAASKISKETMMLYSVIPWQDIIGMRNRLIHGYFDVDIKLVWNTLSYNLPEIIQQLKNILEDDS